MVILKIIIVLSHFNIFNNIEVTQVQMMDIGSSFLRSSDRAVYYHYFIFWKQR